MGEYAEKEVSQMILGFEPEFLMSELLALVAPFKTVTFG